MQIGLGRSPGGGSSTSYSHLGPKFYRFAIEMSTSFDPSEAHKPSAKVLLTNIAKNHD
ncbi:hypothetical protein [Microcoleus sp. CAWBG58]|uniref:hypothetical protein n=1 Tax=Microcoleus sp. CAWBG58 TaxID=2841651 RepID=UPI0025E421A8|nr:hypothetical protein [Microcoleus sp. CAWBG58]